MEKKLWSNAEIVELGLENTESEGCTVNFDGVDPQTDGFILGCIWSPPKYEKAEGFFNKCKYFDLKSPCFCKLKAQNFS